MKSRRSMLLMVLAFGMTTAAEAKQAKAADIDFGRVSCEAFMQDLASATEADAGAIFLWLDGYLSGVSGDTVLRWEGMGQFAEKLIDRCAKRPKEKLLDAARQVGING